MKCKKCKEEMESREFMADWDSENTRIIGYYHCEKCNVDCDSSGDLILERKEN